MPGSRIVPMTKATGLGALPELVEQRASHSALQRIFNAENIPLEIIENRETRLPVSAMMAIFEKAAGAAGERTFGLDVGMSMSHREYGLWMDYCAMAETLGEAIARVARSVRFQQPEGTMSLALEGRHAVWRYVAPDCKVVNTHHSDHLIGPIMRFLSVFLGPALQPAWIELAYPRDPLARLVEDRFDCPVRFGQPAVGVAFHSELLASTRPGASEPARRRPVTMLDVKANEMKPMYDEPVQSIASILVMRLMGGASDIEGTAQAAGYGVQTMQRMLRREGTSYREVLEAVRCMRAKALLLETPLSITDIGLSLGYSDHANFTRAFNRWAGCPPNTFRSQVSDAAAMSPA